MEAARRAVEKITGRTGHTTEVDEVVNPAITQETIKPHRHEEITEAVDREVHQDHYHTTVQPIAHSETLPERHTHNMLPTREQDFVHGDHKAVKSKVDAELAQFANTSTTHATRETTSKGATVAGEHHHHHVHETVQPIIHKETIQPEVVHTTIPVHAVHHAEAQHHGMSALPMKSLSEFKQSGGILTGNQKHAHEEYEGAPRPYNTDMQTTPEKVMSHVAGVGYHTTSSPSKIAGNNTSSTTTTTTTTSTNGKNTSNTITGHRKRDSGVSEGRGGFLDKLNPRTDADRDGKAGIMD